MITSYEGHVVDGPSALARVPVRIGDHGDAVALGTRARSFCSDWRSRFERYFLNASATVRRSTTVGLGFTNRPTQLLARQEEVAIATVIPIQRMLLPESIGLC